MNDRELTIFRMNAILNNQEKGVATTFFKTLGISKDLISDKANPYNEMFSILEDHFAEHRNSTVLFIFENIEYYVQHSK